MKTKLDIILESRRVLKEGINDQGIFHAVFMAGSPGSGKTTAAGKLGLVAMGLRPINSDTAFMAALKKAGMTLDLATLDDNIRDNLRGKAKELTAKQMLLAVHGRLGLVIDATARNTSTINRQKDLLEGLGYETKMIFVDTTLPVALQRNIDRLKKGDRKVDPEVLTKFHKEISKNRDLLKKTFGKDFVTVENNGTLDDLEKNTTKAFFKLRSWVSSTVSNKRAKFWIDMRKAERNIKD
jgi:predicted kinase